MLALLLEGGEAEAEAVRTRLGMEKEKEGRSVAKAVLAVHGMTCHSCVQSVTCVLQDRAGVLLVAVELEAERATVLYVAESVTVAALEEAVEDAGFVVDRAATTVAPHAAVLLSVPGADAQAAVENAAPVENAAAPGPAAPATS